jgi:hypothetical protein
MGGRARDRARGGYRELERRAAELESQLNWRPIPIRKLVAVQLASALEAAGYVTEGGAGGDAGD